MDIDPDIGGRIYDAGMLPKVIKGNLYEIKNLIEKMTHIFRTAVIEQDRLYWQESVGGLRSKENVDQFEVAWKTYMLRIDDLIGSTRSAIGVLRDDGTDKKVLRRYKEQLNDLIKSRNANIPRRPRLNEPLSSGVTWGHSRHPGLLPGLRRYPDRW